MSEGLAQLLADAIDTRPARPAQRELFTEEG